MIRSIFCSALQRIINPRKALLACIGFAIGLASVTSVSPLYAQYGSWPPAFINITPDPNDLDVGYASLDGHIFAIRAQTAYTTASMNAGLAYISASYSINPSQGGSGGFQVLQFGTSSGNPIASPYVSYSSGGAVASIPLDVVGSGAITSMENDGVTHTPTLERHVYLSVAGGNSYNGINQGYPFIRYKISTSDPAMQSATVKIRMAYGGQTHAWAGGYTGMSSGSGMGSMINKTSSAAFPQGPYTADSGSVETDETYSTITLQNGVGYTWAALTPSANAVASGYHGAGNGWVDARVKPIQLMWP